MIRELLARAADLRGAEQRARAAEREAKRIQALEGLARREEVTWREVETGIEKYKYQDATKLLVQLHQLAAHKGTEAAFHARLGRLKERFKTRRTWLEGLRKVGLEESA